MDIIEVDVVQNIKFVQAECRFNVNMACNADGKLDLISKTNSTHAPLNILFQSKNNSVFRQINLLTGMHQTANSNKQEWIEITTFMQGVTLRKLCWLSVQDSTNSVLLLLLLDYYPRFIMHDRSFTTWRISTADKVTRVCFNTAGWRIFWPLPQLSFYYNVWCNHGALGLKATVPNLNETFCSETNNIYTLYMHSPSFFMLKNEWVSCFLTSQQHKIGLSVPCPKMHSQLQKSHPFYFQLLQLHFLAMKFALMSVIFNQGSASICQGFRSWAAKFT